MTPKDVKQPSHYTNHPSGIECIDITKHMGFCLGNAIKYIWRCDLKDDVIKDLYKAKEYIEIEIRRREDTLTTGTSTVLEDAPKKVEPKPYEPDYPIYPRR